MTARRSESRGAINRRDMLKYTGLISAAGLVTASLDACGGPPSTNSAGGNDSLTAVIGYGNNQSWDPTTTASAFSMSAFWHAYEPLVQGDPITRAPYAALAKALPSDVSGTTFQFELRDGATWHDGKPVTADDVVFTYDRLLSPSQNVTLRPYFSLWLDSVTKVDDRTVKFNLKLPFSYALQRIQVAYIVPKHVFAGNWNQAAAGKVVGSGPYKITGQSPLNSTSFTKFAGYNGPRPAVYKTMLWKSITDTSARVATVSGPRPQAQIAENIPYTNAAALQQAGRSVQFADGMNNLYLMFNTKHAPFNDKRVRQALHYAIDRDRMVQVGLSGAGTAATCYINPRLPNAPHPTMSFTYDVNKAKSLLRQAGVNNLKVTVLSSNTSICETCTPVLKQYWDAIGVQTTLAPQDTQALFSKLDGGLDFQVVATTGDPMQFGVDPDLLVRQRYAEGSLWSTTYCKWTTPAAKALYDLQDQAATEPDPAKRARLQQQLMDMLADQAVMFPLVFSKLGIAWDNKKLSGVRAQGYPGINVLTARAL